MLDLLVSGKTRVEEINLDYLDRLTTKAEKFISRKINCTILNRDEEGKQIKGRRDVWKIWGKENVLSFK